MNDKIPNKGYKLDMRNIAGKYENCRLCPRACGVDRTHGQRGLCGMPSKAVAASAVLHKGEEPPLIGEFGSGAVFFSGCTLGCPFCQNVQISCDNIGSGLSNEELTGIFITLQERGAANINLVTATQFVPSIILSVATARNEGLIIPVMWNSSGYESPKTVKLLSGSIDIWLPDIKTLNPDLAERLFNARDYPKVAAASILKMAEAVEARGGLLIENDVMKRGMIVRHLVMPG
jgi:putative pyruvate formate lyase activating enzyme